MAFSLLDDPFIIENIFMIVIAIMILRATGGGVIGIILNIMKKNPFATIENEGFT